MKEDLIIKDRSKKLVNFVKNPKVWVVGFLIIAIILGVYIRSIPMQDYGNGTPGLWDSTTNDWTLGPDLDPWLFTRYAQTIVEQGALPEVDELRNVPLGFETEKETILLPYMIVGVYYIVNIFGNFSVTFAAVIFPVIMFAFTIIAFFLFVREIFSGEEKDEKTKSNIIALISTFFMIVIPVFLSRTIAGIPEKESAGFFFMFIAFYFFIKAWKSNKLKNSILFGILAGLSTALMGLIWGGVMFVFASIAIVTLIEFVFGKINKNKSISYSIWLFSSIFIINLFSEKFLILDFFTSFDTGLALLGFSVIIIHFFVWNTKFKISRYLPNWKLPKTIISIIITLVLILIFSLIFLGPSFVIEKIKAINQILIEPIVGRWNTTVAENRQPYFGEWSSSFGPFIGSIPLTFWMFFLGSVVLFKKMVSCLKKKDSWILTGLYIIFFFGIVFSRYSVDSVFNGTNFISIATYYLSISVFFLFCLYYYIKYSNEGFGGFENLKYEYLFLFVFFILCLLMARSAVRLIMVLAPIAPIFLSYLLVNSYEKIKSNKNDFSFLSYVLLGIIILITIYAFYSFYNEINGQAEIYIPAPYNQQWQLAMDWVRTNTAEDSVFAHWWDYGYWVQSIGKRATIIDGGNAIVYWNYLLGRNVLTGDNQKDALEFLYNHDADYLLIDPTDISKYGAFSSIGSDADFDRYSWIPVMISDDSLTTEGNNSKRIVYRTGSILDEDILYNLNGKQIFLPGLSTYVAGTIIEIAQKTGEETYFKQPELILIYNNNQYSIPLRYIYYKGKLFDFEEGLEGTSYIIQEVDYGNNGLEIDEFGSVIYISPRVMRGLLAQKYILNDPLNNFENFQLSYSKDSPFIKSLRNYNLNLGEFITYGGNLEGPIKIWEIEYTGDEQFNQSYIDKDPSKYLDWQL